MSADLEIRGFDELDRRLNPSRVRPRLQRLIHEGTKLNAQVAAGAITRSINSGGYAPNSALTTAMKGSGRPLVDRGILLQSIEGTDASWDEAVAGILRSRQTTDATGRAKDVLDIATILHEGATIRVTPKMRRFFAARSRQHPGRFFPIRPSTDSIVIPRRPFLESALTQAMLDVYRRNWMRAMQRTLNGEG